MSQRHRGVEAPPPTPKADLRAHAHNERHRIHTELQEVATLVSGGLSPEDVHEPGRAWVPEPGREPFRPDNDKRPRHWKLKMWKRRKALRRERAAQLRPEE